MWRATAFPVKIGFLDARACFPVLLAATYWSWLTLKVALLGIVFFGVTSYLGLTLPAMLRTMRRLSIGPVRPAVPTWRRRRFT